MGRELRKALKRFTSQAGAPSDWQTLGCYTEWCGAKVRSFQQDLRVDPERRGGYYKFGIVVAKQPAGGLPINTWSVEAGQMQVDRAIQLDASWGTPVAGRVNVLRIWFHTPGARAGSHGPDGNHEHSEAVQVLLGCGGCAAPAQDLGLIPPADIHVHVGQFRRG